MVANHDYKVLDIENTEIYYGINLKKLTEEKGKPQTTMKNVGDEPATIYQYKGSYLGKEAVIRYTANTNGKIKIYGVEISGLADEEGKVIANDTYQLCVGNIKNRKYKKNIYEKNNRVIGKISVSCAKYGLPLSHPDESKEFEWWYKKGVFELSVSNPTDWIL